MYLNDFGKTALRGALPHILIWATVAIVTLLPDIQAAAIQTKVPILAFLVGGSVFLAILGAIGVTNKIPRMKLARVLNFYDICSIFLALIFVWELFANKIPVLDPMIFTCPTRIFQALVAKSDILVTSSISSMFLLVNGYFLGIIVGIVTGIVVGWFKSLFRIVYPVAKLIAPIPAVVYIPFALVLLPSVTYAAIFIIGLGAFWPTFANVCFATHNVDRRVVEAAKMLGAKTSTIMRRVILPSVLPELFAGIFIGLILAFIMLEVAEMIGASSGLGFYLISQRLLNHYDVVVAIIVVVGILVIVCTVVFDYVEARALRWKVRLGA
jgi:NitT/TauT family transport system permease protein